MGLGCQQCPGQGNGAGSSSGISVTHLPPVQQGAGQTAAPPSSSPGTNNINIFHLPQQQSASVQRPAPTTTNGNQSIFQKDSFWNAMGMMGSAAIDAFSNQGNNYHYHGYGSHAHRGNPSFRGGHSFYTSQSTYNEHEYYSNFGRSPSVPVHPNYANVFNPGSFPRGSVNALIYGGYGGS